MPEPGGQHDPAGTPGPAGRVLHPRHGPHQPAAGTPPRRPGSIRRTTTHDSLRPGGLLGDVVLAARGRDLRTGYGGAAEVLSSASLDATVEFLPDRIVAAISTDPALDGIAALAGASASSGFRRAVDGAVPNLRAAEPLLFQLLDDVPTALLVSGHALGAGGAPFAKARGRRVLQHPDLCAGWARGGTILQEAEQLGRPPVVTGPEAPSLERSDDALAWHPAGPLPAHGMRRRRRLDVWRDGGQVAVECFFRDSHFSPGGLETVIHEYTVRAAFDPASLRFVSCGAEVGALPWVECPGAVASAQRVAGAPAEGLRRWVSTQFVGTTTCTHLNDTLRSLEDVALLAKALPSP